MMGSFTYQYLLHIEIDLSHAIDSKNVLNIFVKRDGLLGLILQFNFSSFMYLK